MSNFKFVRNKTKILQDKARELGLMHGAIQKRSGPTLQINGRNLVNFANCSYLGLDTKKRVIEAGQKTLADFGTNFCAARTRLSIEPLFDLENGLSDLFQANAITFPSLTTTHSNVLPLLASGIFFSDEPQNYDQIVVFDKFAHSSMQSLIPLLKEYATIKIIDHNDIFSLKKELQKATEDHKSLIYVCDSIYSMGGVAPVKDLIELLNQVNFFLYIDDAHGTSIFGEKGEGFFLSKMTSKFPKNLFLAFSLSKGYGCGGGGVAIQDKEAVSKIRSLGLTYQFSGALDFASVGSALEVLKIHNSYQLAGFQKKLWGNVLYYDSIMASNLPAESSPIRMIHIGSELECIKCGEYLLDQGFYVPTAFFPVVPQNRAQLRVCMTADHTHQQILSLCNAINKWFSLARPQYNEVQNSGLNGPQ